MFIILGFHGAMKEENIIIATYSYNFGCARPFKQTEFKNLEWIKDTIIIIKILRSSERMLIILSKTLTAI